MMAIGDRIRIVTEREYRIMSPPRRPRGEKPQTTIRYLQRQVANLQTEIEICRQAMDDRDKAIDGRDDELRESAEREQILTNQLENSADGYGRLLAEYQKNAIRLAYLEGYHAKSTETIRAAGEGDSGAHPYGAPAGQESEPEDFASRYVYPLGGKIRGFHPNDPAPHHRRPMDDGTIAGAAQDATASELERHRR